MEKLNKLSLPVVIIIASIILGGFFYASQVNKQRSIERQQQIRIEQERQGQLAKELKEQQIKEEAEKALNTCMADAKENYRDIWHRECKAQGKLTRQCIDIHELSFTEYLKKYGLTVEQYVKEKNLIPVNPNDQFSVFIVAVFDYIRRANDECSCSLSIRTADRFNKILERDREECFKRHPQK